MQIVTRVTSSDSLQEPELPNWPDWPWWSDWPSYMIFVMNAVKAVRVKFECKQIPEEPEKYCFWQFCRKFTHFPSVKFSWLKMCACKKNDKYQVCSSSFSSSPPSPSGEGPHHWRHVVGRRLPPRHLRSRPWRWRWSSVSGAGTGIQQKRYNLARMPWNIKVVL